MRKSDFLCSFNEHEMIIGTDNGIYRIYKLFGFNIGEPNFFKHCEEITIYKKVDLPENIAFFKLNEEYRIYRIIDFKNNLPVFDEGFCVVIKRGIGKLEVFDTVTEITLTLPAKEESK